MTKPIVAIVGRPNVGKSTFFNRITRTKDALVDDYPGVTRDRHYGNAVWDGVDFSVVDTGGFTSDASDPFAPLIRSQVEEAIAEADAVVLLLDGKTGISPYDTDMVNLLRALAKPVFYAVNKIDGAEQESQLIDFYDLGLEPLYPVSAEHRYGVNDFLDALVASIARPDAQTDEDQDTIRIAVIGRPNVGKSSLINRILGHQRHVVSDLPGTTRDAVDSPVTIGDQRYLLVDTAGIRRKGKVKRKLEKFSIIKALKSLQRCDLALVMFDAEEGITDQDLSVAGYAYDRGCGCVLLLNKWDLIEKDIHTASQYIERLRQAAKFLTFAPVMTVSAKTGQRVQKIFRQVDAVYAQYATRISTGQLNRVFERAVRDHEPPLHKGRRIKFYYATQIAAKPPKLVAFVNYPDAVHFSYRRYLINRIRSETGLDITPIRLYFRQRSRK